MTPHQIHLVRSSFAPLQPLAATVAQAFYAQLFTRDPALRTLFRGGDMGEQGARLMQMLGAAIELLDRPASLTPVLLKLGRRLRRRRGPLRQRRHRLAGHPERRPGRRLHARGARGVDGHVRPRCPHHASRRCRSGPGRLSLTIIGRARIRPRERAA